MTQTGHRIKWDHFDILILATGQFDIHCKIKETLLIRELKPALNENIGSEKLLLHLPFIFFPADLTKSKNTVKTAVRHITIIKNN